MAGSSPDVESTGPTWSIALLWDFSIPGEQLIHDLSKRRVSKYKRPYSNQNWLVSIIDFECPFLVLYQKSTISGRMDLYQNQPFLGDLEGSLTFEIPWCIDIEDYEAMQLCNWRLRWFRNPANSPVELGSLSHSWQGLFTSQVVIAGFRTNHQQYVLHVFSILAKAAVTKMLPTPKASNIMVICVVCAHSWIRKHDCFYH